MEQEEAVVIRWLLLPWNRALDGGRLGDAAAGRLQSRHKLRATLAANSSSTMACGVMLTVNVNGVDQSPSW